MRKPNTQYPIRNTKRVYAVILVGGKGRRLRPLSTVAKPKAFLSVTRDRKTMFARTIDRIRDMIPSDDIMVVANKMHARMAAKDFPSAGKNNMLLEPVSRNTAPAVAYAASVVNRKDPGAVLVVLPADQYIMNEDRYRASLKAGIDFVRNNEDAIVVLGITPDFPATVYGYIKLSAISFQLSAGKVYKVDKFTEKPDLKTAKKFIKDGRYLWNAGIFIFKARTILGAIKKFAPDIAKGFVNLGCIAKKYKSLPDISIDYAVMERADNIYCVRSSCGWKDVGSFESLKEVLRKESRRFIEHGGKVVKII